mgnify:CR=1 FL=1
MPSISMFYGIVVMMYFYDNKQHHLPHIHVRYQDTKAIFAIDSCEICYLCSTKRTKIKQNET